MKLKYEWTRKVFGRLPGQIEDLEPEDPQVGLWEAAGLIIPAIGQGTAPAAGGEDDADENT